jgi:hypothetical protein
MFWKQTVEAGAEMMAIKPVWIASTTGVFSVYNL